MVKSREISEDLRQLVVNDRNKGLSYEKISEKYKISKTGAYDICKKFITYGTVKNLVRSGRKPKTSAKDDSMIVRLAKKNPLISAREIKEELNLPVSNRTVQYRLKNAGLSNYIQKRKPYISRINKKKRLAFAKEHLKKEITFWNSVLWSDESRFELFGSKKRNKVWRRKGDGLKDRFLKKTIKHGGGSVMVWGCFAACGVGQLELIEGIMKSREYCDILTRNVMPSVRKLCLGRRFTFLQDNDPKHKSKETMTYLKKTKLSYWNGLHRARI